MARRKQTPVKVKADEAKETVASESVEVSVAVEKAKADVSDGPWHVVEHLSDGDMVVEATNLDAYSRLLLLRYRVNGKLIPHVTTVERMQYINHDGTIKAAR